MFPIPAGISFRLRSLESLWDMWAARLNPRYRESMDRLPAVRAELDRRVSECRALLDSLPR